MAADPNPAAPGGRARPGVHFTARSGWINDPHAIAYLDGRYHLFYQYNPDAPVWSPRCHWGHATSMRLGGWTDHGIALSPDDDDTGVWSGCIAVDGAQATLLYTSIGDGDWADAAISIATGSADRMTWTKDPRNPVVTGPPHGIDTVAFRDPFVWRDPNGWSMIVGTGVRNAGGAIARYTSPDLMTWSFDGLLDIAGAQAADHGIFTGDLWECPQLFELDGSWVLMFSVWDLRHVLHDVVYAVGSFDGRTLDVSRWGQFSHGPSPYATTTFVDANGDRVAISWLRERPDVVVETFAGAHSLPVRLALRDDRILTTLHQDVTAMRRPVDVALSVPLASSEATMVTADLGDRNRLALLDGMNSEILVSITAASEHAALTIESAESDPIEVATVAGPIDVTVVIDADIVEVYSPQIDGVVGLRLPATPTSTSVATSGVDAESALRFRLASVTT